MAITGNSSFNARLAQTKGDPVVLVEIAADTDWYFSTRTLVAAQGAGYDNYNAIIANITPIDESLPDEKFGVAIIGDVEVTILNTDPKKNRLISTDLGYAENNAVIIKYGFLHNDDGTDFLLSNFITIYTGVIEDYSWNEQELIFKIIDASFKRHKLLPDIRIKKTDHGTVDSDDVPDNLVGKGYPITYGDMDYALGYLTKQTAQYDSAGQVVWFSKTGVTNNSLTDVYIWMNNRFIRLYKEIKAGKYEYLAKANFEGIEFQSDTNLEAPNGRLHLSYLSKPAAWGTADGNGDDDGELAIDGDITTRGILSGIVGDNEAHFPFRVDKYEGFSGKIENVYLICKCTLANVMGANGWVRFTFNPIIDAIVMTNNGVEIFGAAGTSFDNITPVDAETDLEVQDDGGAGVPLTRDYDTFELIGKCYCGFVQYDSDIGPGYPNFYINELYLRIDFISDFTGITQFYAAMGGLEFGAWIDADSRNNGYDAADLIENPAYIIESILKDELGLANADVDYAAFDVLGNDTDGDIKDYKFAGQVINDINSRDLIDKLCKQSMTRQFKNEDGDETIKFYDSSAASILDFDEDMITNISCGRTPLNDLYNEFYVHYNKNYATGHLEKIKYVDAALNNFDADGAAYVTLCDDSQTNYGQVNRLVIEADWIRDDATAELLCKALVNYYSLRHYETTFTTFPRYGIKLELCDVISIDNDWLPAEINGTGHKWEIVGIKKHYNQVEINAISFE